MSDENKTQELLKQEREQSSDDPDTDDTAGADEGEKGGTEVTFSAEQQARLDEIIAERLKRQREKLEREAEEARHKAEQEAEEARMAEQKKFEELAEKRKAELDELEPQLTAVTEERDTYREALAEHVKQQLENVPELVKDLLEDRDPVEVLNYLTEHADELSKASGPDGPPKTPKPKGSGELTDDEIRKAAWHVRRAGGL